MQIPVRKDSLPKAAGLFVAAVAGGAVAVVGAALFGVGEKTTTVKEVLVDRSLEADVSQVEPGSAHDAP